MSHKLRSDKDEFSPINSPISGEILVGTKGQSATTSAQVDNSPKSWYSTQEKLSC